MKKYVYIAVAVIILGLAAMLAWQISSKNSYKELYHKELQNVQAYQAANSGLEGEIIQHRMTIDELRVSRDSLDRKLVATMDELEIADRNIRSLQYQLRTARRVDTVTLYDTIFQKDVCVDTTIGDYWYNMRLQLEYPSTIVTTPTFNSEQYIYISNRKEYVGGKSRCFFINWFKKKYIVTEVKVEEKNPYINTTVQKFIEIENE